MFLPIVGNFVGEIRDAVASAEYKSEISGLEGSLDHDITSDLFV
jgi:hypothetical protein